MSKVVNLYKGDCLTEHERIEDGSVDLILCDPPYGTVEGLGDGVGNHGMKCKTSWDKALKPTDLFDIANRLLRRNGKLVLFSQEPYTSRLITEAIPNLPFSYRMIWEKDHFANSLIAKKAPVSFYEDILVFSKYNPTHDFDNTHPLRKYFAKLLDYIGESRAAILRRIGQRADHTFRTNSTQFSLCTEATYRELIEAYGIDGMDGFKTFQELAYIDARFKEVHLLNVNREFPSVFNLWEGGKYKSNILRYKKDYDGYHPTQKPVALLDDLIRTYSNEGDLVVDLTMGSGSTGVAAVKAGRRFTGIELSDEYFGIAERRINESLP